MQLQKWKGVGDPLPKSMIILHHIHVVCLHKRRWYFLRPKMGVKWQNSHLKSSIPNVDCLKHLVPKYYNKNIAGIFLEYFLSYNINFGVVTYVCLSFFF